MEYGIFLASSAHSWKYVKRAEELGFAAAWFYDTPMLAAELFTCMGAAAISTSRIKLGSGVLIPSNRIDPVTACALATLNAMAPGRINLGVGTGFSSRRALGMGALSMARLEEYLRVVQSLLRGEIVEWEAEGELRKIRFLNPEIGLINIEDEIPLYISAFGPRMRKMVAALGAGLVCSVENIDALKDMQVAWVEAGRDLSDLKSVMIAGGAVLKDGEPIDSDRIKAQAGPMAAMVFHNELERMEMTKGKTTGGAPMSFPPNFLPQLKEYEKMYAEYEPQDAKHIANHRGHLLFLKPGEAELMTPEILSTFTFTATKTELVERIRGIRDLGVTQFGVEIRHGYEMEMLEDWADVFAAV